MAYIYDDSQTYTGEIVHFTSADKANITSVSVPLTYSQDLHGYSSPWVGTEQDKVPYNFRALPDPDTTEIGNSEIGKIVGGTVAWNQMFNGMTTSTADGITTSYDSTTHLVSIKNDSRTTNYGSGSSRNNILPISNMKSGHVYAVVPSKQITGVQFAQATDKCFFKDVDYSLILRITSAYDFVNAHPIGDVTSFYLNIFDLTAMFGSTIADYLYTLESGTDGAGVAKLKSWGFCTKPYYAYDAGTLMSVNASAHKTVGFNQWDEEWEVGGLSTETGASSPSNNSIRSKNFIPCVPSTTYYLKAVNAASYVWFYDAGKNFITFDTNTVNNTFSTPANCYYMKLMMGDSAHRMTSYSGGCCLNLHWDGERDGEYEPYELHSYTLDSSLTLRGIPKLDANNNLYYDGDSYEASGTVTRKYGIVDLGTLSWSYSAASGTQLQRFNTSGIASLVKKEGTVFLGIVCPKYIAVADPVYSRTVDKAMCILSSNGVLYIVDSAYTSAANFKTAMNGVYLVYELATPTTETADPYTSPQSVSPYGTEEYVDAGVAAGTRDVAIPVGHETTFANICPISGRTGVSVYVSPTQDVADATTYAIDWTSEAGTVYGGTLDVVTGQLVVDRGCVNVSSSWNWIKSSSYPGGFYVDIGNAGTGQKTNTPFLCSHAKTETSTSKYVKGTCFCDGSINIRIMDGSDTVQDWKDYINAQSTAGTPIQICYELATPVTYQLTPKQIAALTENYVWVSNGASITVVVSDVLHDFQGWLLKVGSGMTLVPTEMIKAETYKVSPNQRMEETAERDSTGVLWRETVPNMPPKIEFNTPAAYDTDINALNAIFRAAYSNEQERKLRVAFYDPEENVYKTWECYMPNIDFPIRTIDIDAKTILYDEIRYAFIGY